MTEGNFEALSQPPSLVKSKDCLNNCQLSSLYFIFTIYGIVEGWEVALKFVLTLQCMST